MLTCVVNDSVAISLPSDRKWQRDEIKVTFEELLPDEAVELRTELIDNLANVNHARAIIQRHQCRLWSECGSFAELWHGWRRMFPNLLLGPDVQHQSSKLNRGWIQTICNRLADLDQTAKEWKSVPRAAIQWQCKVTMESESTMANPRLNKERRFESGRGGHHLFLHHARFGNGGRIHLRIDHRRREIEVGYIGLHLPI